MSQFRIPAIMAALEKPQLDPPNLLNHCAIRVRADQLIDDQPRLQRLGHWRYVAGVETDGILYDQVILEAEQNNFISARSIGYTLSRGQALPDGYLRPLFTHGVYGMDKAGQIVTAEYTAYAKQSRRLLPTLYLYHLENGLGCVLEALPEGRPYWTLQEQARLARILGLPELV